MKSKLIAGVVVLCLSGFVLAKGEYAGGSGEAVKTWKPIPFESFKTSAMPMLVYIYDSSMKTNHMAQHIEEALKHDDFKDKLAKFAKTKIKADGSDSKGWDAFLPDAKGGVRLILMSTGEKPMQPIIFDKNTPGGTKGLSKEAILAAMSAVLDYEAKIKAEEAKKDKAADAAEAKAEKAKEKDQPVVKPIAGLEVKEPKVEPKKAAADEKKPAAAVAAAKSESAKEAAEKRVAAAKNNVMQANTKLTIAQRAAAAAAEEEKKAVAALAAAEEAEKKAAADEKKPGDTAKADDPKMAKKKKTEDE